MFALDYKHFLTLLAISAAVLLLVCFAVKYLSVSLRRYGFARLFPFLAGIMVLVAAAGLYTVSHYNAVAVYLKERLPAVIVVMLRELTELASISRVIQNGNYIYIMNLVMYMWVGFLFFFCSFTIAVLMYRAIAYTLMPYFTKGTKTPDEKNGKIKHQNVETFNIILCYGKQRQ